MKKITDLKKIISVLMVGLIAVALSFTLIGCGDDPTPHEHSWANATCTSPKTCNECGATEGDALGHTEVIDAASDATCTEDGLTAGAKCSVCGVTITAQETVSALGHDWIDATYEAPKTCTRCGATEGEKLPAPACQHTNVVTDSAVAPTCTNSGLTEGKRCADCGEVIAAQTTVGALGHNWIDATYEAPKTCSRCGATEGEKLPAPACQHTNVVTDSAVAPTCTNSGLTEGKRCADCGEVIVAQTTVGALGHDWIDATCTSPKTCNECSATEGDALGHDWIDATCTSPKTCNECSATEGDALGHTEVIDAASDATCTEDGLTAGAKCSVCGVTITAQETVSALGHDWIDATCTESKKCNRCGEAEGDALGHTWEAVSGSLKKCSTCGAEEIEEPDPEPEPEPEPEPTPVYREGMMVYTQNFTTSSTVTANSILSRFVLDGNANVSIVNGRLVYKNVAAATSLLLVDKDYMSVAAENGAYTVQFDMEKLDTNGGYTIFAPKFTSKSKAMGPAPNNLRFYIADQDGTANKLATNVILLQVLDPNAGSERWISHVVTVRIVVKPQLTASSTDWGMDVYVKFAHEGEDKFKLALTLDKSSGSAFITLDDAIALVSNTANTNMAYDNIAIWTGTGNMPKDTSTDEYKALLEKEADREPVEIPDFSKYKIVYKDGLDTSLVGGNEKYDIEVKYCYDLQSSIEALFSVKPAIVSDAKEYAYEILIGDTNRQESIDFRNSLDYDEYGFCVVGNKIVISGTNHETTALALGVFGHTLKELSKGSGEALYDGLRVTLKTGSWNLDVPEFEKGTFLGTLDSANGSLTIAYGDTTAEDFEQYCKKLEEYGYELWQRNDIEDNLHATYTGELGMVHTYYTANEKTVRIITYHPDDYTLPKNQSPEEYTAITQTAVTQYALDRPGGSVGMCYVITLEDGSFIVIDSGTQNDSNTSHDEFYKLLKHLNKRPDGKIVIAAWYLTHEHSDHYKMFVDFLKKYGKEITIEELWCNPTSKQYTYNADNGSRMIEAQYDKIKSYVNGDFTWITMHTGMKFYVRNLEIEVLYTEEDLFPQMCRSFNDTDLILKMTTNGYTMLWLGDLLEAGCKTLAAKYDGYLKADLVQVAHHGKSVALPVYQEVRPTVALWSCTSAMMHSQTTSNSYSQYWETNKYLQNRVSYNITSDETRTIIIPFKSGDSISVWNKK